MNWKEIIKVSLVSSIIGYALSVIIHAMGWVESLFIVYWSAVYIILPLSAGHTLSKNSKDKWIFLVGSVLTLALMILFNIIQDIAGF